jgi:hypothetical protein
VERDTGMSAAPRLPSNLSPSCLRGAGGATGTHCRRGWFTGALFVLAAGLVPAAVLSAGGDQPPANDASRDWELAIQARLALYGDAALRPLNLGVKVRERVATVWGVAPTWATAALAVDCVRQVPGVAGVRCELRVEPPATSPGLLSGSLPKRTVPLAVPSLRPTPSALSVLTGRPGPKPQGVSLELGHRPDAGEVDGAEPELPRVLPPFRPTTPARGPGAVLLAPQPLNAKDR